MKCKAASVQAESAGIYVLLSQPLIKPDREKDEIMSSSAPAKMFRMSKVGSAIERCSATLSILVICDSEMIVRKDELPPG